MPETTTAAAVTDDGSTGDPVGERPSGGRAGGRRIAFARLRDLALVPAIIVIAVVGQLVSPVFLQADNLINILQTMSEIAVLVLAQTLVRLAGIGHGPANAAMLPHTIGALAWRFPDRIAAFGDPAALARSIRSVGLAELGVDRAVLPECADAAAARPQLANTPPAADRTEILALYESAM